MLTGVEMSLDAGKNSSTDFRLLGPLANWMLLRQVHRRRVASAECLVSRLTIVAYHSTRSLGVGNSPTMNSPSPPFESWVEFSGKQRLILSLWGVGNIVSAQVIFQHLSELYFFYIYLTCQIVFFTNSCMRGWSENY